MQKTKYMCICLLAAMLSACQPPSSGEAVKYQELFLQLKLKRNPLQAPLVVPVEGVTAAQIADTWGGARSEGRRHEGVDIFAKRGTAVLSATEGIVRKVGTNRLGGKIVSVTGPSLSQHYYAHLEDYASNIQVGDWVEAGDVLGYVGNSGNAKNTPPHLHYGIYLSHGAVNPYPYLKHTK